MALLTGNFHVLPDKLLVLQASQGHFSLCRHGQNMETDTSFHREKGIQFDCFGQRDFCDATRWRVLRIGFGTHCGNIQHKTPNVQEAQRLGFSAFFCLYYQEIPKQETTSSKQEKVV